VSQVSDDCPEIPDNDECETAFNVTAFPFSDSGSTLLASPLNISEYTGGYNGGYNGNGNNNGNGYNGGYNEVILPPDYNCRSLDPSSKSVWYLVEGDGSCMTSSVTSSNFDPSVSVFRGNQCGELTCISRSDDYNSKGASWKTVIGETYYVIVGGRYRRVGDFFLDIEVCCGRILLTSLLC
jgi:hypothetical protein